MKHIHTFESFINEGSLSIKKSGDGEIAVKRSDASKLEKILKDMNLDFVDIGHKDSSQLNFYKVSNTNWDTLNDIGDKVDLQSMTILEGELYDVKKKVKAGKMHKLLGIPEDKEITDVYKDPKKLAEDLIKATGDKKEATGMLAFSANINPSNNIFDKALKAMPEVK